MVSYLISNKFRVSKESDFEYLRLVFTQNTGQTVPTVYCQDMFADQIAAEEGLEKDYKIYTNTYSGINSHMLCPNITETVVEGAKDWINI